VRGTRVSELSSALYRSTVPEIATPPKANEPPSRDSHHEETST
jgi:hypothetical protein